MSLESRIPAGESPDGVRGWSKEIAEHLRNVHLTLIAVSAGLVLVALSEKPYDPTTALRELEEIQVLQKEWSPQFLHDSLASVDVTSKNPGEKTFALLSSTSLFAFPCWIGHAIYNCKPVKAWFSGMSPTSNATLFPKTVAEFSRFWDSLANKEPQWVAFAAVVGEGTTISYGKERERSIRVFGLPPPEYLQAKASAEIPLWPRRLGDQFVFWDAPPSQIVTHVSIPIVHVKKYIVDQTALARLFPDWQPGAFETSFKDLARASQGSEQLEFDDVRKRLEEESSHGSDVFEVFGLKIPSAQLTVCGILLVLCIQFYLFAHLRELSTKLNQNDSAWGVAWIAMFPSIWCRYATWATLVALPILAISLLSWHGASRIVAGIPWRWQIWRSGEWRYLLRTLPFCLALSASGLLGWCCWSNRPRIHRL